MMQNVEELTQRGFELDMPTSLPPEEERSFGGRRGGRGDREWGMRPGGSSGGRGGCVLNVLQDVFLQSQASPLLTVPGSGTWVLCSLSKEQWTSMLLTAAAAIIACAYAALKSHSAAPFALWCSV